MKIEIELTEQEIKDAVLEIVANNTARALNNEYGSSIQYVTRKEVKAVIRELLRERMDELSDRAVKAAAKTIENKSLKKMIEQITTSEVEE